VLATAAGCSLFDVTNAPGLSRRLDVPPRIRVLVALAIGIVVGVVTGLHSIAAGVLGGWAAAGAVFVVWTWTVIVPMDAEATRAHATREQPARVLTHWIIVFAAVASLGAVVVVLLGGAGRADPLTMAAVLVSVLVSWAVVHTLYALMYARMYYTEPIGGVDFHQQEPPRYTDFTYIGVTVGMSFAISDTDLAASAFRRVAQVHALLSYLFGTVILALLVNLVAGLVS